MKCIDRRESFVVIAAAIVSPLALFACQKGPLACTTTSSLTPDELTLRTTTLAYTDVTADLSKTCAGCQLFKPVADDQCGACLVVKGPINPHGSCKSWAKKV